MIQRILVVVIMTVLLVSCGSSRRAGKIVTKNTEAASIISRHYVEEANYKTASGKLRAVYQDEEKSQSVNLSFRMEKDRAIWMSASILGFPVAKIYITPSSVSYYEKVSQSYFEGDFRLISDFLGTPLDFQKLQNLLIGQAIYDLRNEEYEFTQSPKGFQFVQQEEGPMDKMFLLDGRTLKAAAQQLAQAKDNRNLTVTYSDYQVVDGIVFPEEIRIIASENGSSTNIEITYKNISFNEDVTFPFEIPSGYEEISLK